MPGPLKEIIVAFNDVIDLDEESRRPDGMILSFNEPHAKKRKRKRRKART